METCLKGIAEHFPLTEKELRGYSSLGLAYIGDCIYELFVRTMVVTKGNDKANHYHQKTISYVNAAAQTAMMEKIKPLLTDEEKAVFRRGKRRPSRSRRRVCAVLPAASGRPGGRDRWSGRWFCRDKPGGRRRR